MRMQCIRRRSHTLRRRDARVHGRNACACKYSLESNAHDFSARRSGGLWTLRVQASRVHPDRQGREGLNKYEAISNVSRCAYRLYEHSGFSLAGAVAFSFVVSIFPFCIFLGALSGVFGGRELADQAIAQLFEILPRPVVQGLESEVRNIMGTSRINLLTASGFLALFFATSAIETMRAALNGAYRVHETRPYPLCLMISMLFVFVSAVTVLVLTWAVVVGP